jgi:hypothetical protein
MKVNKRTREWIAWGAVSVVLTLVAIFLGVKYPAPPQPLGPVEELGTTHFTNLEAEDIAVTDDLTVTDDVAISGDVDINGNTFTIDADADTTLVASTDDVISVTIGAATGYAKFLTGNVAIGNGTPGGTINGEDLYVEGYVEIDGELEADGAIDADSTLDVDGATNLDDLDIDLSASLNIDGHMVDIGTCSTPSTADADNDLCVAGDTEIDGELELDGALDADSTANFAGVVTLGTNVENVIAPSVATLAVTYTTGAGGTDTLATIGAGEVWIILGCYANVTTNWDVSAGDDAYLNVGDDGDADGLLDLDDAELQAADTEGTGAAAGWQGFMSTDTRGAYMASTPYVYGLAAGDTIDVAWGATGDDLTAGELTLYLVYIRIK